MYSPLRVMGWLLEYAVTKAFVPAIAANYHMGNYRGAVWVIGDGRSGTTWLSDLINWEKSRREVFEPFHPRMGRKMRSPHSYQYIRPGAAGHPMLARAASVFSGKFRNARVDHANRRLVYRGLVIKDIFAHLFACWATNRFPEVKTVLLIRNPLAVSLSKLDRPSWYWMTDPRDFLLQEELAHDHLGPFERVIGCVGDDALERQVMIWAVIHHVLLKQVEPGRLHVMFYENLVRDTGRELARLFHRINPDMAGRMAEGALRLARLPSRTAGGGRRRTTTEAPVSRWRGRISPEQVRRGRDVLAHFGLDGIYGDGVVPNEEALWMPKKQFVTASRGIVGA